VMTGWCTGLLRTLLRPRRGERGRREKSECMHQGKLTIAASSHTCMMVQCAHVIPYIMTTHVPAGMLSKEPDGWGLTGSGLHTSCFINQETWQQLPR
jgi:hypothetical protein